MREGYLKSLNLSTHTFTVEDMRSTSIIDIDEHIQNLLLNDFFLASKTTLYMGAADTS